MHIVTKFRIATSFLTAAIGVALLASCTSTPAEQPELTMEQVLGFADEQEALGNTEQADALQDGVVTSDEYRSAFEDFAGCLVAMGYPSPKSWTSPIDGNTTLFRIEDAGKDLDTKEKEVQSCSETKWTPVSTVFQDTTPNKMDDALRRAAITCLEEQGYELTGDEDTPEEMGGPDGLVDGVASERVNATIMCLMGAQTELYPEIEVTSVSGW